MTTQAPTLLPDRLSSVVTHLGSVRAEHCKHLLQITQSVSFSQQHTRVQCPMKCSLWGVVASSPQDQGISLKDTDLSELILNITVIK